MARSPKALFALRAAEPVRRCWLVWWPAKPECVLHHSRLHFVEMFAYAVYPVSETCSSRAKANSLYHLRRRDDAVGRQRGAGLGGVTTSEQTPQPVASREMIVYDRAGVILIAATNRPDILDRLQWVERLTARSRYPTPIWRVEGGVRALQGRQADGRDRRPRRTGQADRRHDRADLANVINEAALLTAWENGTVITGPPRGSGGTGWIGGPRRKGRIISGRRRRSPPITRAGTLGRLGDARYRRFIR